MQASSPVVQAPKRAALGFLSGVRALFGGAWFIISKPSMWGWALVPTVVATALFAGTSALAIWGGTELAHRLLWDEGDGTWTMVGIWALRVVLWLIGLVVAFVVAMSLAQPISGFALEAIARRQELELGGRTWPDQPFVQSTLRSLRVTLSALAISLPILAGLAVVTLLVPPLSVVTVPLKLLVTGITISYDFLDYPLSLRGAGVRSRMGFVRDHFWATLGFGTAAALLLLIPGVGLLLLPYGVAGATRLVLEGDRRA